MNNSAPAPVDTPLPLPVTIAPPAPELTGKETGQVSEALLNTHERGNKNLGVAEREENSDPSSLGLNLLPVRRLFGIEIHAVNLSQAVDQVIAWTKGRRSKREAACRFVVTPNVDHIVQLQSHGGLQAAYRDASLILADGWPVVTAARWLGQPLPARVPGSDLVPALFSLAPAGPDGELRVFLLGAAEGVADRAAQRIHAQWPSVRVVGTYSPPLGFEQSAEENRVILSKISESQPDVLVVGLGAPKQELWVSQHQQELNAAVALCVGATIDFLAGEKRRAPRWIQQLRMEWLHRLCSEPQRLARRYWHDARIFPQLVWREYRRQLK
jgi:N-acetylglucosaminyldiphosphoundecaprenol N-acetyl-beta-D-mannosaminyltransferase